MHHYILLMVSILIIYDQTRCEIYTSVSDFETFLFRENHTFTTLENYLILESQKMENYYLVESRKVDSLLSPIIEYKTVLSTGVQQGVENPVQIYLTLKNVLNVWKKIEPKLSANFARIISQERKIHKIEIPSEEELNKSRDALYRLQKMYRLRPADVAIGKIQESAGTQLTLDAKDCYQMGVLSWTDSNYNSTFLWMEQALKRLKDEQQNYTVDKVDIMKYYANALFKLGHTKRANILLCELVTMKKDDESFYKHIMAYSNSVVHVSEKASDLAVQGAKIAHYNNYQSLCNGDSKRQTNTSLKCYYKTDSYFLRLAPIKVELLHLNPDIYLFHQIISDKEIEIIKNLSKPKLHRGLTGPGRRPIKSEIRTAKIGWLYKRENELLSQVDKRISDMTNLNMQFSEPLQVANYGIGGHYEMHFDAFGFYRFQDAENDSDRIATVLFYLTTPNAGGATVFLNAQVSLFPIKNSAIFWYNLLKNGDTDIMTNHAGCPVLHGDKWIANKWIRERGQKYEKMCGIHNEERNTL